MEEENEEIVEQTTDTENIGTQPTEQIEDNTQDNLEHEETKDNEPQEDMVTMTQEELNNLIEGRLAKQKRKLMEQVEEKYGRLENVVNAGLGTDNANEAADKLAEFYKSKGIEIPEQKLTARQERILAEAEANDIIEDGYDSIAKEVDRLTSIGLEDMTPTEKTMFNKLAKERQRLEGIRDLKTIGVSEDILKNKDFIDFTEKLNPALSVKEKYEMYEKTKPKKEINTIGSMKNNQAKNNGLKDFYSFEEASEFTQEQLMKNPKLLDIIQKSASKW